MDSLRLFLYQTSIESINCIKKDIAENFFSFLNIRFPITSGKP